MKQIWLCMYDKGCKNKWNNIYVFGREKGQSLKTFMVISVEQPLLVVSQRQIEVDPQAQLLMNLKHFKDEGQTSILMVPLKVLLFNLKESDGTYKV